MVQEMQKRTRQPNEKTKERPIIFSSEMIKAILSGSKTQTRRVVTPQPGVVDDDAWAGGGYLEFKKGKLALAPISVDAGDFCPYGKPGDCLWVRETFYCDLGMYADGGRLPKEPEREVLESIYYRADGECCQQIPECQCWDVGKPKWRPSIFLPRYASRITLEITNVRVERLQYISSEDAQNEGVEIAEIGEMAMLPDSMVQGFPSLAAKSYRAGFAVLWDKINGKKYPWTSNPWVWVIEFSKVKP